MDFYAIDEENGRMNGKNWIFMGLKKRNRGRERWKFYENGEDYERQKDGIFMGLWKGMIGRK